MPSSDKYKSYLRNIKKKRRTIGTQEIRDDIERSFHTCMVDLPETLRFDIVYHMFDSYAREGSEPDTLLEAGEKLGRIVELFEMDYDAFEDDLADLDWIAVRDVVDEAAQELDVELIQYIMQRIVRRGLI